MILGIGTDIANITRFAEMLEKHGERFAEKHFSPEEQTKSKSLTGNEAIAYMARRWAAKEALAKAMGTGFRDGIYLKDIAVLNDEAGKPYIELSGGAEKAFEKITPQGYSAKIHLSISDDFPTVVAFVIIESEKN